MPHGLPWQEPDGGWQEAGRTDLHTSIDTTGRTTDRRDDFAEVYGDWDEIRTRLAGGQDAARPGSTPTSRPRSARPNGTRPALTDDQALALLAADGAALEPLTSLADAIRRDVDGRRRHLRRQPQHQLHQRLLHRLPVLRVRAAPHRRRRLHAVAAADRGPGAGGMGGRGDRGVHAGRHPPGPARNRLLRHRRRSQAPLPGHARARLLADGGGQRGVPHRAADPGVARSAPRRPGSARSPAPPRRSSTTTCAGS